MKVFVAGATGLVGRRIVSLLLDDGHEVVALTRRADRAAALEVQGAELAVADALDARALAEAVVAAARELGFPRVRVRPVGRNTEAIRFFHAVGFDVLGRVDVRRDLEPISRRPGERIADRDFRA